MGGDQMDHAIEVYFQSFAYIADIQPDSGALPFRATLKEPFNAAHFHSPNIGQLVRVKFKDGKVKFDKSDPEVFYTGSSRHRIRDMTTVAEANSPEAMARWNAIASAAPGTPLPAAQAGPLPGPPADISTMVGRISADAGELADIAVRMRRARESGNADEANRLKSDTASRWAEGSAAPQAGDALAPGAGAGARDSLEASRSWRTSMIAASSATLSSPARRPRSSPRADPRI